MAKTLTATQKIVDLPEIMVASGKVGDLTMNGVKLTDFVKEVIHKDRPTLIIGANQWKQGEGGNGQILSNVFPNNLGNAIIALFGNKWSEITNNRHLRIVDQNKIHAGLAMAVNETYEWSAWDRSGGIYVRHYWSTKEDPELRGPVNFSRKHAALWAVKQALETNQCIVYSLFNQDLADQWASSFTNWLGKTVEEYNADHGRRWLSSREYHRRSAETTMRDPEKPLVVMVNGIDLAKIEAKVKLLIENEKETVYLTVVPGGNKPVLATVESYLNDGYKVSII